MVILIKPTNKIESDCQQKGENSMTDITCHIKDCLHNKRNKCTANAIVLGSKGNCKAKAFAKDMMKHSRKPHWRGGMYGG